MHFKQAGRLPYSKAPTKTTHVGAGALTCSAERSSAINVKPAPPPVAQLFKSEATRITEPNKKEEGFVTLPLANYCLSAL
jgi:hypothetical protein